MGIRSVIRKPAWDTLPWAPSCGRSARVVASTRLRRRGKNERTYSFERLFAAAEVRDVGTSELESLEKVATEREMRNDETPDDTGKLKTLTEIWSLASERCGDEIAVYDPHRHPPYGLTYNELRNRMEAMAYGLQSLGLLPGESVALFSEGSPRWIVADQGVMMNAAINAVRGASAPLLELQQIVVNSESVGMIVQDEAVLERILNEKLVPRQNKNGLEKQQEAFAKAMQSQMKFAVVLWGDISLDCTNVPFPVYTYDQVLSIGEKCKEAKHRTLPVARSDDTATLVYTSGTSGTPKGVPLTHANILYQLQCFKDIMTLNPGDQILSLLPPWHIYERTTAYYVFKSGCRVVYSSVNTLKRDLSAFPSEVFITVPLVLDTLHKRIMQTLRNADVLKRVIGMSLLHASFVYTAARRVVKGVDLRFAKAARPATELAKALVISSVLYPLQLLARRFVHGPIRAGLGIKSLIISGGGSLASHLDLFFEAIGLTVLNGWGLTETSPVLCCRPSDEDQNVRGSVGRPIPQTEIKVVDPDSMAELPDGTSGLLLARGPGVMRGYHSNAEETAGVMLPEGWFATGDRGWRVPSGIAGSRMGGNIVLTGRLKDTIVLSSGENIAPQLIEDWLQTSPLIANIMVIGQDHRTLGALVVPDEDFAKGRKLSDVHDEILSEIRSSEKRNPAFVRHMHVSAIQILERPFTVENGTLTKTMKLRREAVLLEFSRDVELLLKRIR